MSDDVIKLDSPRVFETERGERFLLRPGNGGEGVAVIPLPSIDAGPWASGVTSGGHASRGRPPRPGTVALRERLAEDVSAGTVEDTATYMRFLLAADDGISVNVARQIVYREMQRAKQVA